MNFNSPIPIKRTALNNNNGGSVRLAPNFAPDKNTVICGRGRASTNSPGNRYLKSLVQKYAEPYSNAKTKLDKSTIVSDIISTIKKASPGGCFVKFENGSWFEVDDTFAREKVGCLFRDLLHEQYQSSTKAKQARKKQVKKERRKRNEEQSSNEEKLEPKATSLSTTTGVSDKGSMVNFEKLASLGGLPGSNASFLSRGNNSVGRHRDSTSSFLASNRDIADMGTASGLNFANLVMQPRDNSTLLPSLQPNSQSMLPPDFGRDDRISGSDFAGISTTGQVNRISGDDFTGISATAQADRISMDDFAGFSTTRQADLAFSLPGSLNNVDDIPQAPIGGLLTSEECEEELPDNLSDIFD